jgi:hypothetical protein
MRFCSSAGLLVLLVGSTASAQGGLTATPNPYDAESGVPFVIRNATATPVSFDSLRIASTLGTAPSMAFLWVIQYDARLSSGSLFGEVRCSRYFGGPCLDSGGLSGQTFAPGDSALIYVWIDTATRPAARRGGDRDTLWVYSQHAPEPLSVDLRNVPYSVASEVQPGASALGIRLSPNPAGDSSTLTLALPEGGTARVVAYDALGREVAVLHDGPASETLSLRVDTSAWPPGVYVVRAEIGERAATVRLVVAR